MRVRTVRLIACQKQAGGGILGDIGFSLVLEDGAEEDEAR